MGWKPTDVDPKKTFDKLTHYFEGTSSDGSFTFMRELINIRRETFASMESFQMRINYLKNRLQAEGSDFRLPDRRFVWMAVKGIAKEYPDLYNRCVVNIQSNADYGWSQVMEEFQRITVAENSQPALSNIKFDKPAKTDDKVKPTKRCDKCNGICPENHVHCDSCGHHKKVGSNICWWCNPDKAPDTWRNKKAKEQKEKRLAIPATTRTISTTGLLHQQSGVSNPVTSTMDKPKSVLFSTNLTNLPASGFPQGPQCHY